MLVLETKQILGIHIFRKHLLMSVFDSVACRAVSRQRLGKLVPAETNTHALIERTLETTFSTRSMKRGYKEDK
jgi:hypothetical protein